LRSRTLTLLLCLLIVLEIIVIISAGPATGYEVSIYDAYPLYFWILQASSLTLGVFLLLRSALCSYNSLYIHAGLTIAIFSNVVLLLLPFFRGYIYLGWNDLPSQIGFISDIQLTGRIGIPFSNWENPYPALHVLVLTSSYIIGLSVEDLMKLLPAFFFAFFIIFTYLLSKKISTSKSQIFLITAFGVLPLYAFIYSERIVHLVPRNVTFLLTPFIFYLYFANKQAAGNKYQIPILLWLLMLPTWHPGNAFILILTFLCLYVGHKFFINHDHNYDRSLLFCLILTFSWLAWFMNLNWFNITIRSLALHFGESEIEGIYRTIERVKMPLTDSIILFIKMSAHLWLYFLMGILLTIYLLWNSLKHKKINENALLFALLFLFYSALTFASLFFIPIGSVRALSYSVFTSTILSGLVIPILRRTRVKPQKNKTQCFKCILMMLLLLPSIVFSHLNMYTSPFIKSANDQVTLADITGFKLFLTHQTEQFLIEDTGLNQKTKIIAITGLKSAPRNVRDWQTVQQSLPEHFGYNKHSNLGMWYEDDRYLIVDQMSKIHYEKAIPEYREAWRWAPEDFLRLYGDCSVFRTYDNGGFWIYYIIHC